MAKSPLSHSGKLYLGKLPNDNVGKHVSAPDRTHKAALAPIKSTVLKTRKPYVEKFSGTLPDVIKRLNSCDAVNVVAFALHNQSAKKSAEILKAIESAASLIVEFVGVREQETVEKLVQALIPKTVATPRALVDARMQAAARAAVLASGDWLTAVQVATIAGLSMANPSAQPNKWKRDALIFTIISNGVDFYPAYGLDKETDYRPLKALAEVLRTFEGQKSGWALAYWFASVNSFLGGKRPQDLLATAPQKVVAAARDESGVVTHG